MTTWPQRGQDPGRDASLKYKYDPNIPAYMGKDAKAKKPATAETAASKKAPEEAKKEVPKALSQLDLQLDTVLSKEFQTLFQRNRNGQNERKDIAENDIDQWVYDNAEPSVNALPHGRTSVAPKVDQYWLNPPKQGQGIPKELGGKGALHQQNGSHNRKDIVEKDIDHWVWEKSDESVPPLANSRGSVAPKVDQYWLNPPKQGQALPINNGLPRELTGLS